MEKEARELDDKRRKTYKKYDELQEEEEGVGEKFITIQTQMLQ